MKEAISYDYGPVPMIREFSRSNKLIRGLVGPFGSGKSSGCVVEILRRSMAQKPGSDGIRRTRWACIRNSYPQLRDTTIKTSKDWVDFDVMGVWRERDHSFTMKFGDVEAEVLFRALDRPDDTSNLLSLELTAELSHEALEIQEGAAAAAELERLLLGGSEMSAAERAALRAALLAYCRLDTLAMVRIVERLRELAATV